tara:strand:- start:7135 stop:7323 length:189 start_codon:yes stop_codon:yes gene_type:complete
MKNMKRLLPVMALTSMLAGLAACSSDVGPAQTAPGQMGSTATPASADLPDSNSQSLPVEKPN